MNQVLRQPMALDEFLAWEREQDTRYEFDGRGPVAMTGGTLAHRVIADQLTERLNAVLRGTDCLALAGDVKILVAGKVRYPDIVVTCAKLDMTNDIVPEPVLVAEILSLNTARTDRILKLDEYRRTPSIQHYLLLEHEAAEGVLFTRQGDAWIAAPHIAPADIVLSALGITVPLADAYRRVAAPG